MITFLIVILSALVGAIFSFLLTVHAFYAEVRDKGIVKFECVRGEVRRVL